MKGVVHVGGHKGEEVQGYLSDGRDPIIVFEPQRLSTEVSKKVRWIPLALGDEQGEIPFYVPVHLHDPSQIDTQSASGLLLIHENAKANGWTPTPVWVTRAKVNRFDKWAKRYGYIDGSCDLLVIDVQGMELQVLKGFGSHIMDFEEIRCECSEPALYEGGASATEVSNWLYLNGFTRMTPIVRHGDVRFRRQI